MTLDSNTPSLASQIQLVAQAINNASVRNDMPCLSLAKAELDRLCSQIDELESRVRAEKT